MGVPGLSGALLSPAPTGLSSDSGLGGSSDGSSDVLAFGAGSVVDSVTEEGGCPSPPQPSPTPPQAWSRPLTTAPRPHRGCRV